MEIIKIHKKEMLNFLNKIVFPKFPVMILQIDSNNHFHVIFDSEHISTNKVIELEECLNKMFPDIKFDLSRGYNKR